MKRKAAIASGDAKLPDGYAELVTRLKERIRSAQVKAAFSVNREMIQLYFDIGKEIHVRQKAERWGKSVVEHLSRDLGKEFPGVKGFSARALWEMRRFYAAYHGHTNLQQLVAEIPWGHNLVLLTSVKDLTEREWYIRETIRNGWSRNVLVHQIGSDLYRRTGKAITNFTATLPAPQSDLANAAVKDPYILDFLCISDEASERELHKSLLERLMDFLLELGTGFAYVGSEYHLAVGDQDYYLDLLFYHTRLHCYIVIELKVGPFLPEYAGKLNFYLSAADDLIRNPSVDQPSIGILLCREKNRVIAEYALRDITKPMAVSTYQLGRNLPHQFATQLPSAEQLEEVIASVDSPENPAQENTPVTSPTDAKSWK